MILSKDYYNYLGKINLNTYLIVGSMAPLQNDIYLIIYILTPICIVFATLSKISRLEPFLFAEKDGSLI